MDNYTEVWDIDFFREEGSSLELLGRDIPIKGAPRLLEIGDQVSFEKEMAVRAKQILESVNQETIDVPADDLIYLVVGLDREKKTLVIIEC